METPQQPQYQPVTPAPAVSSTPKWALIVGGILLAGAIGAAGYFAAVKQYPIESPTTSPTASIDPTADWKTYTNTEYGFELKFPPTWDGYRHQTGVWYGYKDPETGSTINFSHPNVASTGKQISLMIFTLRQWNEIESGQLDVDPVGTPTKIAHNDKYVFATSPGWEDLFDWDTPEYVLEIKQILSTFRFTNTADTSSWKTFNSQYFKISFKVPTGIEVTDSQNVIRVSDGPLEQYAIGSDNSFFTITRYTGSDTKTAQIAWARQWIKNATESQVTVDGSKFLMIRGDDYGRYEGDSAGKVTMVFFDASWLEIIERPANETPDQNYITLGDQILSTFQFTNTADTSSWKTVTNNYVGYSVKYPSDYEVGEHSGIPPSIAPGLSFTQKDSRPDTLNNHYSIYTLGSQTLEKWWTENNIKKFGGDGPFTFSETTINQRRVLAAHPQELGTTVYAFSDSGHLVIFAGISGEILSAISTFRFTK